MLVSLTPEVAARYLLIAHMRVNGGPGSGNFGHAGRKGEVGGSGDGGGGYYHGTSRPITGDAFVTRPQTGTLQGDRGGRTIAVADTSAIRITNVSLKGLGGPGSGDFGHSGRKGEVGGSGSGGGKDYLRGRSKTHDRHGNPRNERSKRALKAFTMADATIQRHGESAEHRLAQYLSKQKGVEVVKSAENKPLDNVLKVNGKLHGVEVKTMITVKSDQVTVRKDAMERKVQWAKEEKAKLHMIIYDDRHTTRPDKYSGHPMYYYPGSASPRVGAMVKVTSATQLVRLISTNGKSK